MNKAAYPLILIALLIGAFFVGRAQGPSTSEQVAELRTQIDAITLERDSLGRAVSVRADSLASNFETIILLRSRHRLLAAQIEVLRADIELISKPGPRYASVSDTTLARLLTDALYGPGGRLTARR